MPKLAVIYTPVSQLVRAAKADILVRIRVTTQFRMLPFASGLYEMKVMKAKTFSEHLICSKQLDINSYLKTVEK